MTPAVRSTLDVVLWFLDRAASAGSHLSARRLQCLLFMAQARYARANDGRKLMPATFLAAGDRPHPSPSRPQQSGVPPARAGYRPGKFTHTVAFVEVPPHARGIDLGPWSFTPILVRCPRTRGDRPGPANPGDGGAGGAPARAGIDPIVHVPRSRETRPRVRT